jgi:hypothetical protein
MAEVAEVAGMVADFLDGVLATLAELSSRLGDLTPELEAEIVNNINRIRIWLPFLGESVEPCGAPLLRLKRRLVAKAGEMLALGMSMDEIRWRFVDSVDVRWMCCRLPCRRIVVRCWRG